MHFRLRFTVSSRQETCLLQTIDDLRHCKPRLSGCMTLNAHLACTKTLPRPMVPSCAPCFVQSALLHRRLDRGSGDYYSPRMYWRGSPPTLRATISSRVRAEERRRGGGFSSVCFIHRISALADSWPMARASWESREGRARAVGPEAISFNHGPLGTIYVTTVAGSART